MSRTRSMMNRVSRSSRKLLSSLCWRERLIWSWTAYGIALLLMTSLIQGCMSSKLAEVGWNFRTAGERVRNWQPSERLPIIFGEIEISRLGEMLEAVGLLEGYQPASGTVLIDLPATVGDLEVQLSEQGYGIVDGFLVQRQAHHPIEAPDTLGRPTSSFAFIPRPRYLMQVRFVRADASVTATAVADAIDAGIVAGMQYVDLRYRGTFGVPLSVSSENERGFFENFAGVDDVDTVVVGRRDTVTAGISLDAMVGRSSGFYRVSGILDVSAFAGESLDRSSIAIPIELDGRFGRWVRITDIDTADVNARVSLTAVGWDVGAGGGRVSVWMRVGVDAGGF